MSEPLEERARVFGFTADDRHRAVRLMEALNAPDDYLDVAMDLARFVNVSLLDAVWAVHTNRDLHRLGLPVPKGATRSEAVAIVRAECAGQASAYTRTMAFALALTEPEPR